MGSLTIPMPTGPEVIVGPATADDAGVFRLGPDLAMVQTVDVFTPIVDDPFDWGRIAAVNALSDVYAMGGRPVAALNVVCWPRDLGFELLGRVLDGASSVLSTAGCVVLGGHSIDDPEPKYGMAVTGLVHPDRILRNVGARPGDRLLLTKPLGSGIVTTAIKRGVALGSLQDAVTRLMAELNRAAGEALAQSGAVHALTDVTGFGLLGHAWGMAEGSGVGVRIRSQAVPVLDGVVDLAAAGVVPGGSRANLEWVEPHLVADPDAALPLIVLADAQTNGGLLAAVAPERSAGVLAALAAAGVRAADIGEVLPGAPPHIEIV
jgi:selenide,water dikinase